MNTLCYCSLNLKKKKLVVKRHCVAGYLLAHESGAAPPILKWSGQEVGVANMNRRSK